MTRTVLNSYHCGGLQTSDCTVSPRGRGEPQVNNRGTCPGLCRHVCGNVFAVVWYFHSIIDTLNLIVTHREHRGYCESKSTNVVGAVKQQ